MSVLWADHVPGTVEGFMCVLKSFCDTVKEKQTRKRNLFYRKGNWEPEKLSNSPRIAVRSV